MANGRNSGSDREAMLRRIAIVLSSLPTSVASGLLGSVDPQSTQAVRRAMTGLEDVDPLERQRALQAFKGSVEQRPKTHRPSSPLPRTIEDEVVIGQSASTLHPTSRVVSSSLANSLATPSKSSPLSFLGDVDDETLVSLLTVEHPQAIALVLASIAPPQAARVLPRLDPRVQTDTLSRIGRLGEIPETAVAEVAEHFKNRVAQQSKTEQSATGQRALDAILAALPSSVATATIHPASEPAEEVIPPSQPSTTPASFPSADVPAIDLTRKIRVAEHTWPEPPVDPNHETQSTSPSPTSPSPTSPSPTSPSPTSPSPTSPSPTNQLPANQPASDPARTLRVEQPATEHAKVSLDRVPILDSTDAIHQHLLRLTPAELCQSLGRIETRGAMLALCGLPNQVAESVLEILPRGQAKQVRIQMNSLGSLHLREIDEAKEKVAQASLAASDEKLRQVPLAA